MMRADGNTFVSPQWPWACPCLEKAYFSWWITHPDQMTPPVDLGREDSISSFFLNSQILNQKPQTKAICSLSCCVWSGHASGPARRKALKPKTTQEAVSPSSGLHSNSNKMWTVTISLAIIEGLLSVPRIRKMFLKKPHKRYVTSMILVGVGQDQTYPSLVKECKQLSSRWCESEWSNVAWTPNVHHPHAGRVITTSTLFYPTNFISIFQVFILIAPSKLCRVMGEKMIREQQASCNISPNGDTHALRWWLVNFHHSSFASTQQQQINAVFFAPQQSERAALGTCEIQTRWREQHLPNTHKKKEIWDRLR